VEPLDPHAIAFITLVNDETQYATCLRYIDALQVPSGFAVEKITIVGATSMVEGCRRGMEASIARYKVYVHQDVYLVHRGLLPELLTLFNTYPRLGMVGVVGTTRMSARGIWWVNNPFHCYGRVWVCAREGGFPMSLLGRRLHLQRFRSFVGDYMPAVAVDGQFMATQYDIPWVDALGGFELYDQVQALEFIKAGLEVGIAREKTVWCIHWGPLQERSEQQRAPREVALHRRAAVFRRLNHAYIGVPARRLLEQYRGTAGGMGVRTSAFRGTEAGRGMTPRGVISADTSQERLGVVIVSFNGREVVFRALRTLLSSCAALQGVACQVVVVDNASTDGTVEAIRREFPQVSVIASAANDGPARGFNQGLRQLHAPNYVLVMHHDVEFATGTLDRMVTYLRQHPSAAGVVASLTDPRGAVQVQRLAIVELIPRRTQRPQLISFVATTCALVRGEVFFDVGLYDEHFKFQKEDLEWSLRAKRRGYRFAFLPAARVIHHSEGGMRQNRPEISADLFTARLWLVYKHGGRRWASAVYWIQRLLAKWSAFRWRDNREALHLLGDSMARMENLYCGFRAENARPLLSTPDRS
jgi:GT2 family glycosyltransferase